MENEAEILRGLEPIGATEEVFGHNREQAEAYRVLVSDGLCSNDAEAKLAALAVLDAQVEKEFIEDEDPEAAKKLQYDITYKLEPEAKKHCFKCPVIAICTDYRLGLKRMDGGVLGGMSGAAGKRIGKDAEIPQVEYPRIRDAHSFDKAG